MPVSGEHFEDAERVGVKVEKPAALAHRTGQVCHRLEPQRASDVGLDWFQGGDAGAAWQAKRSAVDPAARLRDAGNRAGAQPGEQGGPVEWRPIGEAQRERAFNDVTPPPATRAELGWGQRKHLAHRVVELPDALEASRERDVREGQIGRLDQGARRLRPLGAGDRERTRAELGQQQPVQVTLAYREAGRNSRNAFAIDGPIRDQAHRAPHEIPADVPLGRAGGRVRATALAGAKPGQLGGGRRRVEAHVRAPGTNRGWATRPAVDAGGRHGGDEPAVEACVCALDGPITAFEVQLRSHHDGFIVADEGRSG